MDKPLFSRLARLSPKRAPFRRAGYHFGSLEPLIVPAADLSEDQVILLAQEPLVDLDDSQDGGETWRRWELPADAPRRPVTDAALSPDRAIDPTGAIVPRAPIDTGEGEVAPPNAADPAVPIAQPAPADGSAAPVARGRARVPGAAGEDRPVAGTTKDEKPVVSR